MQRSFAPDTGTTPALLAVLRGEFHETADGEWQTLLAAAARHGVLPHLAHRLLGAPDNALPASIRVELRARLRSHQLEALALVADLHAVHQLLTRHDIALIALKGPALSAQLYGDPTLRVSHDLDLLVTPDQFPLAHDILTRHGYVPEFELRGRRARALLARYHDFGFRAPSGRLIELHWQLVQSRYMVRLDLPRMWRDSVAIDVMRVPLRVFRPEDLLPYLAMHAAKHRWSQLDLVLDVAALLRTCPLDLEAVRARAAAAHTRRILEVTLQLAVHVEPSLSDRVSISGAAQSARLLDEVLRAWHGPGEVGPLAALRFDLRVRERWRDRIGIALSTTLTPGLPDWLAVSLPDRLFPLYHVVRPLRLIGQRLLHARHFGEQRAHRDG